mgnify:CR=1 FL=1
MYFVDVTPDRQEAFADLLYRFYAEATDLPGFEREEATRRAAKVVALSPDPVHPIFLRNNGGIIGYMLIVLYYSNEYNGFIAVLDEFFILPEFRGRGFGGTALELLKNWVVERGLHGLTLEVVGKGTPARALYERHGFTLPERRTMCWFPR